MLTVPTATHIRGARHVKGFRACEASTGVSAVGRNASQFVRAELRRCDSQSRRRWLARCWEAHRLRVRTTGRSQPPKAHGHRQEGVR